MGEPHFIESPDLSLIDVNSMTRDDINSLTEAINGLNDEYATEVKETNEIIRIIIVNLLSNRTDKRKG